jgi:hypothetical protein
VLLLYPFNHTLNHRFRIASGSRGCVSCLLANLVGAAIVRGAAEKNKSIRLSNAPCSCSAFNVALDL